MASIDLTRPLNLADPHFINNKWAYYDRLLADKPVHEARITVVRVFTVARYDDCTALLKDPRIARNRSNATGSGGRFPFPMPRFLRPLAESMINEDAPNHRRLRELVRKAFRPQAIARLETRIDAYSHELLDELATRREFDLQADYALPIPMRLISDMLGVSHERLPAFHQAFGVLTEGLSGWRVLRTIFYDLRQVGTMIREMIAEKRATPGDDILTALIDAEADGDRLSEDEIVGMAFLLIIAGFETTVHLITNGVHTLLNAPEQRERLRADPGLMPGAVEEILRYRGPVHGTKPNYAREDITLHGVTIPQGKAIMPLLGAANVDPRAFPDPHVFDITRTPNHHLSFGHGVHFCLGAHLARAEARCALTNLFSRFPDLELAIPADQLTLTTLPGWHRYSQLPVRIAARRMAA